MTYEEAIEADISRAAAIAEIRAHNCYEYDFFTDVGDKEFYKGSEILNWLGY